MAIRTVRYAKAVHIRIWGEWCVYCGEKATSWDHFPPKTCEVNGFLLPCCIQCNCIAGDWWPYNFVKRANYVKEKLDKKYRKVIESRVWYESEISSLRRGIIRDKVTSWESLRRIAKRRLAWNAASYLACIDVGKHFAAFPVGTDTTLDIGRSWFEKLNFFKRQRLEEQ